MIFSLKPVKPGHKFELIYFVCLRNYVDEPPFANMKMERQRLPEMPLILGRFGTQYVAMVTKLLSSYRGAHLLESYCKETNIFDTNRLRYLHILSNFLECMMSSLG